MPSWQWETFEAELNAEFMAVTNPGPLPGPVKKFRVHRNKKLDLVLKTTVSGTSPPELPGDPPGTVRQRTETVEFGGPGATAVAHGVIPYRQRGLYTKDGVAETTFTSTCSSIAVTFRAAVLPAYSIDWIENLKAESFVWIGSSISDRAETCHTRGFGRGDAPFEIVARSDRQGGSSQALHLVIGGTELYLCPVHGKGRYDKRRSRGYLLYIGDPDATQRTKIREVLSFCLGTYLVYLGNSLFGADHYPISMVPVAGYAIGGRAYELPALPPAPLGHQYERELNEAALSAMATAIYDKYDDLTFESLSWSYWHAVCAPPHMAAAHWGALLEAIQKSCAERAVLPANGGVVEDDNAWDKLRVALLTTLGQSTISAAAASVLERKIKSLNELSKGTASERFFGAVGVPLGKPEKDAWKFRHKAAHGDRMKPEDAVKTIRGNKLLMILVHRVLLTITQANKEYFDYYTIGHYRRQLNEPVP